ncbi:MAG TPA: helix-hairpin-helix domain-containing protein [Myxococcota bacterium]|nr:helix-hairpin-helix domain-containing protein [Myxococcota bacterium]
MRARRGTRSLLERLAGADAGGLGPVAVVACLGLALLATTLGVESVGSLDPKGHELAVLGTIDVNTATVDELQALPGIGPSLAGRMVEARPFDEVADLERVVGIGPVTRARLSPFVVVAR